MRLASRSEIDLLLVTAPVEFVRDGVVDDRLASVLRLVLCDVGVLVTREPGSFDAEGPVVVPFGAGEHDWAALSSARGSPAPGVALSICSGQPPTARRARGTRVGSSPTPGCSSSARPGVRPVPRLVAAGHEGVAAATAGGGVLVIGLSERWADEGLGATRSAIASSVSVPVVFVRRGLRPGGRADPEHQRGSPGRSRVGRSQDGTSAGLYHRKASATTLRTLDCAWQSTV